MTVGLKGNSTSEANSKSGEWGPVVGAAAILSTRDGRHKLKWESELSYDDDFEKLSSDGSASQTRVRTLEFKYAKLSPLRVGGRDLKDSIRLVPFVGGGLQRVWSSSDEAGAHATDDYWSPSWSVGGAVALSRKSSLSVEFEQNVRSGKRRITRLELELKFAVIGDEEE